MCTECTYLGTMSSLVGGEEELFSISKGFLHKAIRVRIFYLSRIGMKIVQLLNDLFLYSFPCNFELYFHFSFDYILVMASIAANDLLLLNTKCLCANHFLKC